MGDFKKNKAKILLELSGIIEESLDLLENENIHGKTQSIDEKLPTNLLDQCLELCEQYRFSENVSVRTLHHFGLPLDSSLFSSLATLPNTSVLKDIHPKNSFKDSFKSQTIVAKSIIPTKQVMNSTEEHGYQNNVFLTDLQQKVQETNRLGQQLLICDNHCLSHTNGEYKLDLLSLLNRQFTTHSLIIVADPVDSYHAYCQLSEPGEVGLKFEDYCQYVLAFIEKNSSLTVIKHDDFVANPERVMMEICDILDLLYYQEFGVLKELFDSAKEVQKIDVTDSFPTETEQACSAYLKLCELFGYRNQVNVINLANENDSDSVMSSTSLSKDDQSELISVIKTEIYAELKAAKLNPYAHNRTMTLDWNKKLRGFAETKLNLQGLKPAYIDYLGKKVIHIERNCVGRLATTIQDAVTRQLVAQSVKESHLRILEIGTLYGINLAILYNHGITRFKGVEVVCLDPFDGFYGQAFDPHLNIPVNENAMVRNMKLSSVPFRDYQVIKKYSTDPEAIAIVKTLPKINLLIIDGDHSYEGIKFDFVKYFPMLTSGGYVIFDDYNAKEWPGVQRFIDEEIKTSADVEYIGAISRTAIVRKK